MDGSEQALRAVEWAAREAVRRKAPLRIVSVSAMPSRMRPYGAAPATVADTLHKISAQVLAEALTRVREVAPGPPVDAELVAGAPAPALTSCCAGASMLVVGARGAGGFRAMVLGSVSRYVAMHAPCPVVVAHEDDMAVLREIVVGVGDPAEADGSLGFAFEEASIRGARLTAVHVVYQFPLEAYRPGPEIMLADGTVLSSAEARAAEPPQDDGASAELVAAVTPGTRSTPRSGSAVTSCGATPPASSPTTPAEETCWSSAATATPREVSG